MSPTSLLESASSRIIVQIHGIELETIDSGAYNTCAVLQKGLYQCCCWFRSRDMERSRRCFGGRSPYLHTRCFWRQRLLNLSSSGVILQDNQKAFHDYCVVHLQVMNIETKALRPTARAIAWRTLYRVFLFLHIEECSEWKRRTMCFCIFDFGCRSGKRTGAPNNMRRKSDIFGSYPAFRRRWRERKSLVHLRRQESYICSSR